MHLFTVCISDIRQGFPPLSGPGHRSSYTGPYTGS